MEYGGASERVSLWLVPPSCHMSFDRGSSLTDLCLCRSLSYQPFYDTFRTQLEEFLPLLDQSNPPTTGDKTIDATLEVLRTEKEKEDDEETDDEETDDEETDDEETDDEETDDEETDDEETDDEETDDEETDDEETDDEETDDEETDEVDEAVKILVRNATKEFGFVPRDVYEGVVDLPKVISRHTRAVKIFDYSTLRTLIDTFSTTYELHRLSHHVVVVRPVEHLTEDEWAMDFKSVRIRRKAIEQMRLQEDKRLRETFDLLRNVPEGAAFAGWVFEAIADRMLSNGWRLDGSPPQPVPMTSNRKAPSTFSTVPNSSPSRLPFAPLRPKARVLTLVDFTCKNKLSNLTLDGDKYYKPTTTNNPLFDSFTIDWEKNTVTISIFQITTSQNHGGSPKGYLRIQKIIARVRELLKVKKANSKTKVGVRYFLVCPRSKRQHQWKMPDGWGRTENYHGKVFCVRIPTLVHCVYSLPTLQRS